jgi:hypothetical protein
VNCIYLLAPNLTVAFPCGEADLFYSACIAEIQQYTPISAIRNIGTLIGARPDCGDAVAFFNCSDEAYRPEFLAFLEEAVDNRALILPIALTASMRRPPDCVLQSQTFDVVDQLRRRDLLREQMTTIASAFARQILARIQPTLSVDPMQLFLSHRRLDGEGIAAAIHKRLLQEATAWRDLMQIRVGEDAQEKIEAALLESDAIVFIDTPKTGESVWVARELETGLGLNLPVVWVRIGGPDSRAPLAVKPAAAPHFEYPNVSAADGMLDAGQVRALAEKAFELARMSGTNRVIDRMRRLRQLAKKHGAQIKELDSRRLLYSVELPRKGFRYPQRPMTHLIQAFGRRPQPADYGQFSTCAVECGYDPHPHWGPYYDAALLLTVAGCQPDGSAGSPCNPSVESLDNYIAAVEEYLAPPARPARRRGLIISGAFPLTEPELQQNLTDAVHAFTRTALDRGADVIFGAHPTFQHLIFDLGRRCRPTDRLQAIRMYISEYFATPAAVTEFKEHATVFATPSTGDRAGSLTLLRKSMVDDPHAAAVIVIGGRTAVAGHIPGVDEEVQLARTAGLPVFLVGSCGGRSAELSCQHLAGTTSLNNLAPEDNRELATSTDYASLASMVLDSVGI